MPRKKIHIYDNHRCNEEMMAKIIHLIGSSGELDMIAFTTFFVSVFALSEDKSTLSRKLSRSPASSLGSAAFRDSGSVSTQPTPPSYWVKVIAHKFILKWGLKQCECFQICMGIYLIVI